MWDAARPIFAERMSEAIPLISASASSSCQALADTMRAMKGVVREIRLFSDPSGAARFTWQAYWLGAAHQAWAQGRDDEVCTAPGRASLLLTPAGEVRTELDCNAICEAIRQLRHHQISADLAMDTKQASSDDEKRRASARHAIRRTAYSPSNLVVQSLFVVDSAGDHISEGRGGCSPRVTLAF